MREIDRKRKLDRAKEHLDGYLHTLAYGKGNEFSTPDKFRKIYNVASILGLSRSQVLDKINNANRIWSERNLKSKNPVHFMLVDEKYNILKRGSENDLLREAERMNKGLKKDKYFVVGKQWGKAENGKDKTKPYRVFAHIKIDGEGRTRSQSNTVWAINKKEAERRFKTIMRQSGNVVVSIRDIAELEFKTNPLKFPGNTPLLMLIRKLDSDPNGSLPAFRLSAAERTLVNKNKSYFVVRSAGNGQRVYLSEKGNEEIDKKHNPITFYVMQHKRSGEWWVMRRIGNREAFFKGPFISRSLANKELQKYVKHKPNFSNADFRAFTKDRLIELSEMFQGVHNGKTERLLEPDDAPKDKFRLGHLVQIKYKMPNGKINTVNFDGDSILAGDIRCNLWPVGKDARINGIQKPAKYHYRKLGDVTQIDYVTAKQHIENGHTVRFFHRLGEVTREKPKLVMDHDGFPLIIGGGYDIWDVGIVN